jgi:putative hemolysin
MPTKTTALAAVLAVLAAGAGAPLAHGERFFPSCGLSGSLEWEERCAQEHHIAEEEAHAQAAEEAKKAEEAAPPALLEVAVHSHHGSSYSEPGYTVIAIFTSPYAYATFKGGHASGGFRQLPNDEIETDEGELVERSMGWGYRVPWSCKQRGQTIAWTVEAHNTDPPSLVRTGTFVVALSAHWCAAAKHIELVRDAEQRAARRRAEAKEHEEAVKQRAREVARFETNCRAIGGIPVEVETSKGPWVVCHSKTGGIIEVPD